MGKVADALLSCPVPRGEGDVVRIGHGGGGRLTAALLERVFLPRLANPALDALGDGAVVPFGSERLAMTTDTFVVTPHVFPGGDIGSLAVHGTVNDLAMCGAEPLFLSAGFVIEEGFPIPQLERLADSMAAACRAAGAPLVTGDTKVVERGKADGVFVNTAGVGRVLPGVTVGPSRARPGDVLLVSGPVGDHGIAVLSAREGIGFATDLVSDSAPVVAAVQALLAAAPGTRVLRDPTRGGLATALVEIALASGVTIRLAEEEVPVREAVRAACGILGFDPLYVACEGRFLAIVPREDAPAALAAMRAAPRGEGARVAGRVTDEERGRVVLETRIGSERLLERLSGDQLPRIC